jgi:hypothetical protein
VPKIDLTPHCVEILSLYHDQKHTLTQIANEFTNRFNSPVTRRRLSRFIEKVSDVRDMKEVAKVNRHTLTERSCKGCDRNFMPTAPQQKMCRTCIPNRKAGNRYSGFRLTQPQFDAMLAQQNNSCKLCERNFTLMPKSRNGVSPINVDHDHKSGRVRGLLCKRCNMVLGCLETVPGITDRIALYLAA